MRKLVRALALVSAVALVLPAIAAADLQQINQRNSSADWVLPSDRAIDYGSVYGYSCANPSEGDAANQVVYQCYTEYAIESASGKIGARRYLAAGQVIWDNTGLGDTGTEHSSVRITRSWMRRWHRNPQRCLASRNVIGWVVSNIPCDETAELLYHQYRGVGMLSGIGLGTWPWLFVFHCRQAHGWTSCSNKVGDAYKYAAARPPRVISPGIEHAVS